MTDAERAVAEAACHGFDAEPLTAETFARMVDAVAKALGSKVLTYGNLFTNAPTRADHAALVYVTGKWLERMARR